MCCWSRQRLFCTCFQPARASQLLEHSAGLKQLALIWKNRQASRDCGQDSKLFFGVSIPSPFTLPAFLTAASSGGRRAQEPQDHLVLLGPGPDSIGTLMNGAGFSLIASLVPYRMSEQHPGWTWLCFWMALWNQAYLSLNTMVFVASFSFFSFTQGSLWGFYILLTSSDPCEC